MIDTILTIINIISQILVIVIIIDTILSYFLPPFQAIRRFFDQIVNPLLEPIRKLIPPIQNIDFSPMILIVVIQVFSSLLTGLLQQIR